MRTMLAKSLDSMRAIRREVLVDGNVSNERVEKYIELVVKAASFADSLINPEIVEKHLSTIINLYNDDSALRHYDSNQDLWWNESSEGKKFLEALRLITIQLLHGNVYSREDAFHVFQILKCLYEEDKEYRKAVWFILPAYGGICVDFDYLQALLIKMTGNNNLIVNTQSRGPTLILDWYPDDGKGGVQEILKIIEAAAKLGYIGIEFKMPQEYKYEDLYKNFGSLLEVKNDSDSWKGRIRCGTGYDRCKSDTLFQSLENNEKKLSEIPPSEFDGRLLRYRCKKDGRDYAVCVDFPGFANRILFTITENEYSAHGGIYVSNTVTKLPDNTQIRLVNDGSIYINADKKPSDILESFTNVLNKIISNTKNNYALSDISAQLLEDAVNSLDSDLNAVVMFIYATLTNSRTGEEMEIEEAGE